MKSVENEEEKKHSKISNYESGTNNALYAFKALGQHCKNKTKKVFRHGLNALPTPRKNIRSSQSSPFTLVFIEIQRNARR